MHSSAAGRGAFQMNLPQVFNPTQFGYVFIALLNVPTPNEVVHFICIL